MEDFEIQLMRPPVPVGMSGGCPMHDGTFAGGFLSLGVHGLLLYIRIVLINE
jgi:hypothetical protein